MKMTYYVVLPNLQEKGMSPAKRMVRALLEINQKVLAKEIKFFADNKDEAIAYMQALPRKPEKYHCLLELSIDHSADALLTKIKGVHRFYSIHTNKVSPIAPACVSAMQIYPGEEPEPSFCSAAISFPKDCTPFSDVSDPASVSFSSTLPRKGFQDFDVLDDFDLTAIL